MVVLAVVAHLAAAGYGQLILLSRTGAAERRDADDVAAGVFNALERLLQVLGTAAYCFCVPLFHSGHTFLPVSFKETIFDELCFLISFVALSKSVARTYTGPSYAITASHSVVLAVLA